MEPMNLGSPGSPSASAASFLPAFLSGEHTPAPRTTNQGLSPTKRALAFGGQSPVASSPDFNRNSTSFQQRFNSVYSNTPTGAQTANTTGPPTQGLFDSLRNEKNALHTPVKHQQSTPSGVFNNSVQFNQSNYNNDSYLNQSGFNVSRITSPISSSFRPGHHQPSSPMAYRKPSSKDFWITVFGFPQTAVSLILSHFSQCGTIIDKILPTQNGNWIHLKFTSRLECDKALNYNCKIICNNLMIGVIHCNDESVVDKENNDGRELNMSRLRPLANVGYQNAQSPTNVIASPIVPQRSSGIVNKAMDLFFGW